METKSLRELVSLLATLSEELCTWRKVTGDARVKVTAECNAVREELVKRLGEAAADALESEIEKELAAEGERRANAPKKTATLIVDDGEWNKTGAGRAWGKTFRMDPPLNGEAIVKASAAVVWGRPEVYLFPADEEGTITDLTEMDGSEKGTLDHEAVIAALGYEIVTPTDSAAPTL